MKPSPIRIDGDKAADILRDNLIELWCEPGGAIYSQSGTVVAEVMESRVLDGNVHVVIDINRFQLGIAGIESPADPIMLSPHDNSGQKPKPERCLLVGNLCAEIDVLHQRFITLPRRPQSGDLIVWANLGAYGSYFSAARAIGHPLAAEYIYEKGEFHVV